MWFALKAYIHDTKQQEIILYVKKNIVQALIS